MAYPLPVSGDGNANGQPWASKLLFAINDLDSRAGVLESTTETGLPGYALLSTFSGADSTAKMRNALATLAVETAGTRRSLIIESGTTLAPGSDPFQLSNGIVIVGGIVPTTEFAYQARVTISGACPNGVFQIKKNSGVNPEGGTNPSSGTQTRGVIISNIAWEGPGSSVTCDFFERNFTEQLAYSLFHGCSFDNFTGVLHQRLLGFVWSGVGYCNNSTDTPFRFSGSDWKVFTDGYFLDSPNLTDEKYLLEIVSGNKVYVGPMFITGDGPTPVRVTAGQMVRLASLEMESEGVPRRTAGAGLLVTGGNVVVDNAWFFRSMANPTSAALLAASRTDNGVVHVTGGHVRLHNATFGEYNNSETHTENHISCTGGRVISDNSLVWNLEANSGTGGISARALAIAHSGSGSVYTVDTTVVP